jgi:multiple sugar transport system substrate-binding protein
MKKLIAAILAALIAAAVFAGGGQAKSGDASPDKPFKGVTLRFVTANQPCIEQVIQGSLAEFEELTGAKVEMEIMGTDQFTNKVMIELAAKTKTLDVICLRPLNDLKLFNQNGWLTDITSYFKDDKEFDLSDYFEGALESCMYEGKLLGIPVVAESQILYYRKDIFEQRGLKVPETMDEMLRIAKSLTDKSRDFYGFVGRGQSNACISQFSTYLYSYGGTFNSPTQSLIATPAAINAYKMYGALLGECGPAGVINMSWPQAAAVFAQGKAAMFADSDAIYQNVINAENSVIADKVGYGIMPAGPVGRKPFYAVAVGLAIPAFSEHKEAAVAFIKWALSKGIDLRMTQETKNPGCRKSTWNNAAATASWPPELLKAMTASREVAVAGDRPTVINVVQARDIVSIPILEAIAGKDPTAAAQKANAEFQALIDKENSGK